MSDYLSSAGIPADIIAQIISNNERRFPSLVKDNARIRQMAAEHGEALRGVDVTAALMSDCRTDFLTCGRCTFWRAAFKLGFAP